MARTDAAAVKLVLAPGLDYDTERQPSLTPFIDAASSTVDDVVDCASDKGVTLTAAKLELIERWLAAHLYKMSDQQLSSKNTSKAGGSFRAAGGLNLDGSTYGQVARGLDSSGCLAVIGAGSVNVARVLWGGTLESDRTNWEDRN